MKCTFTRDLIQDVGVIRLTKTNKDLMLKFYDVLHKRYSEFCDNDVLKLINDINISKLERSDFTGIPDIIDLSLLLATDYIERQFINELT